jgi:hypothetical protein
LDEKLKDNKNNLTNKQIAENNLIQKGKKKECLHIKKYWILLKA